MGSFGGGERPDMGSFGGGMPDMGSFGGGEIADIGTTSSVTAYIPVGVTVHTAADVSTTFSRLAGGDLIKMLVETNQDGKDIIEEIWMLQ